MTFPFTPTSNSARRVWCSRLFLATGLAVAALASGPVLAEISKSCLNSDAAAQARLMQYDADAAAPEKVVPAAGNELPTSTKAAANDLTAYSPYQMPKERLLDWTTWPYLSVTLSGRTYRFLGVHVTNKGNADKPPCIRLMFRLFAPTYREVNGIPYLHSEYENGKVRRIGLRDAVGNMVAHEMEDFYVVDLDLLRNSPFWKKRYETYRNNVARAKDAKAYPVHFERLLFNILRWSRNPPKFMPDEDKAKFILSTRAALRQQEIDCDAAPEHVACILNSIFMETELGRAHPLVVTDALDNSGLAFGPRQLDLGQQRKDATDFALRYLIQDDERGEGWQTRFLKPIEQMTKADLRQLYPLVIPTFNGRLGENGEQVLLLYIKGLLQMVGDDYKLGNVKFDGRADLLAQTLAADFSNKWGKGNAVTIGKALSRSTRYDECGVVSAWRDNVRARFQPGDLEDFRRRTRHIVDYFSKATRIDMRNCTI